MLDRCSAIALHKSGRREVVLPVWTSSSGEASLPLCLEPAVRVSVTIRTGIEGRRFTGKRQRRISAPPRPEHQRRGRRRQSLLRHASDSQVRLQVAADRTASKHFGRSRNRGNAGPRADAAAAVDGRRRRELRDWRVGGLSSPSLIRPAFVPARVFVRRLPSCPACAAASRVPPRSMRVARSSSLNRSLGTNQLCRCYVRPLKKSSRSEISGSKITRRPSRER